jgi:DNA-binding PadR family transcriptional regulator
MVDVMKKKSSHVYAKEAIVLRVLLRKRKAYGLEIVRLSGDQIVRDTVYRTLHRMTQKKWVVPSAGTQRCFYKLTPLGRDLARRLRQQSQPIRGARPRKRIRA